MSEWLEITDYADVDISDDGDKLDVLFETNEWGSRYITIPLSAIFKAITKRLRRTE